MIPISNGSADNLLGDFDLQLKTDPGSSLLDTITSVGGQQAVAKSEMAKANNLLDLLEGLDFGPSPSMVVNNNNNNLLALNSLLASPPPASLAGNFTDHLAGLTTSGTNNIHGGNSILVEDIFGDLGGNGPSLTSVPSNDLPPLLVYDKNEFKIVFNFEKTLGSAVGQKIKE